VRDHSRSRDRASQCIGMMAKRRGIESNLRHKLLGDSLETLAFAVFAFETFQTRVFSTSNISHFIAASQHAPLFDRRELEPIVCHEPGRVRVDPGG